jgi:hypothetical protein
MLLQGGDRNFSGKTRNKKPAPERTPVFLKGIARYVKRSL